MAKTLAFKSRTRIAAWNILTLKEASKLAQVEREMARYKIEILGLSEVRWPGSGEMVTTGGNTFLYSGQSPNQDRGLYGVGILMTKAVRKSLLDWNPISERIITMRFRTRARNMNVVQCYAPTEVSAAEDKDAFYESLTRTVNELNKGEIVIMMGDFNAQIGGDNGGVEHIMGRHALGRRTDNGDRFIELCQQQEYVIGGSLFPHKDIHKYTWKKWGGASTSQIDHITVSKEWRHTLRDVRTRRGADAATDHVLLTADVQLKVAAIKRTTNQGHRKYDIAKLKSPENRGAYTRRLRECIDGMSWREAHETAAREVLGTLERRPKKKWISDDTWRLIEERHALKQLQNTNTNNSPELASQYANKNRQVKKSARRDKRRFMRTFANEAEEAAKRHDLRALYRKVKTIAGKRCIPNQPIKDKNGNNLASTEQQLARWKEHFSELLNFDRDDGVGQAANIETAPPVANIRTIPPSLNEVSKAIEKLKCNKAAGTDGLPAELLRADPRLSATALLPDIIEAWETETFARDWKSGVIVKLPKKGDLRQCGNWRGITILNVINKIVAHIILGRIHDHLESSLRDEQAGFRAGRGCIDQSNTLRLVIEQSTEYQAPLYMVFVDFEKAFDRIDRNAIWNSLARRGIPVKLIRLIRALYEEAECSVLHNGQVSEAFTVNAGVRQGCILSPLLFITVLDEVMREVTQQCPTGIWWTLRKKLNDLDFADDLCLLSNSISGIQAQLLCLDTAGRDRGLRINIGKTKLMRINENNNTPVMIGGIAIEEVSEFCYLGSTMAKDGGTLEDIKSRVTKARAVYGGLNKVWNADTISARTKVRIFKACVLSVLLYGSETWRMVQSEFKKLQVFVNRCLRRILRIFWPARVSNEELYSRAEIEPVTALIQKRKWGFIGHTLRRPEDSITRQALKWNPQGKRKRGRPKVSWRSTVDKELEAAGVTWRDAERTAANRTRWRVFSEALRS